MNRVLVLPMLAGDFDPAAPGEAPRYARTVGRTFPPIRCGQCGKWGSTKGGHVVDSHGYVTPSWLHEPCGWHVFLILVDWSGSSVVDASGQVAP